MFAFTGSRRLRPVQAAPGVRRLRADRVRRVRHPQRELRDQAGHQPRDPDPAEHRELPPPAPADRRDVRLAPRALDHRSAVLQVDPVDLPPALQGGEGVQEGGGGQLVPARTRPCSPTSRSSTAGASGAAAWWSSGSWSSGSSGSPSTPSGCWPTWTTSQDGLVGHAPRRRSATGSGGRRARRSSSRWTARWLRPTGRARARVRASGSSPRGRTPSSARRSWCWRRSTRWWTRSRRRQQRKEVEAYRKAAASKDLVSRKVGDREKTGVFTGGYAHQPGDERRGSRSGSRTTY